MVANKFGFDEVVNQILTFSKSLVDVMNSGKNIAEELKVIQYLIFASMLLFYGFEEIETIHKAFRSSNFIYTEDDAINVIRSISSPNDIDDRVKNYIDNNKICSFVNYKLRKDLLGKFHVDRNIYIINNENDTPDCFLEKAIHEINHVVNSVNCAIGVKNDKLVIRNGIFLSELEKKFTMGNYWRNHIMYYNQLRLWIVF